MSSSATSSADTNVSTIVAPATTLGRGAIAIARLSGPEALRIALKTLRRETLTPRYAHLLYLYDANNEPIDRAIVVYFNAPKSYTGEDIVEFQTHGGEAAINALMETLTAYGAVLARSGEFSLRAVKNGKMALDEAEAAAAYAAARAAKAANLLAKHLRGDLARFTEDLRSRLVRLIAYAETAIDYAEEDLGDTKAAMRDQLDDLERTLREAVAASLKRKSLLRGFEIAIIGKPNAGKSSLLNALLGESRSIVSDQPGTTRDLVGEELRIGEHIVRVLDTAGLREGGNEIETIGIEYAKRAAEKADFIVALFDGSQPFDKNDEAVLEFIRDKEALAAINKRDLEQKIDLSRFDGFERLFISAKNDVAPLLNYLRSTLDRQIGGEETTLVSERQIALVSSAAASAAQAREHLEGGELELFSYRVQEAIGFVGAITRPADYGETLDAMFSEFCLGK
ncbi:MAG: tRNA uridine-5-carboxymethylaminomethyl(34) synthesis GTPase MnmE [Helicobacteraceae bacterium]|jgi:tRNA modification GTPase|nr:tRNA uridine-5-carboxymethylaminomethyl(34) synthesis GTPase MnmE [Helicobacteraceae bacterium]